MNEYVVPSTNRIKNRTTALRAAGPSELVTWLKDGIGDICRSAINRSDISGLLCFGEGAPGSARYRVPDGVQNSPGLASLQYCRLQLTYADK